jgi:hypothetical protein
MVDVAGGVQYANGSLHWHWALSEEQMSNNAKNLPCVQPSGIPP